MTYQCLVWLHSGKRASKPAVCSCVPAQDQLVYGTMGGIIWSRRELRGDAYDVGARKAWGVSMLLLSDMRIVLRLPRSAMTFPRHFQ